MKATTATAAAGASEKKSYALPHLHTHRVTIMATQIINYATDEMSMH